MLEHAIRSRPSLRLSISVKEASIFLDRSSRALCLAREDGAKAVHCAGILETAKNALEQSFFAVTFASRAKSRAPAHAYCGMLAARCRGRVPIDLSHNCARDPEKNRANASVGQKIWREPRISSLFVWRNKRWRPCRLRFSGCSCAGLPIFQLRIASMSGQS